MTTQQASLNDTPDTEQAEQEIETSEEVADDEVSSESAQDDDLEGFDPKERVEISDPKVRAKFNHIYKQMKMSDNRNTLYWDLIQKQQQEIDSIKSKVQQTDQADAEKILKTKLKEAREIGDDEAADKIMDDIIEFRLEKKLQEKLPKTEKPNKPQIPEQFNTPEGQELLSFAYETNDTGELAHGWMDSAHPQHQRALKLTALYRDEVERELGVVDVTEVLKRVASNINKATKPVVKPQNNNRAPDPLGRGLTNNSGKGKLNLSTEEMAICKKLGVSTEEYRKWK